MSNEEILEILQTEYNNLKQSKDVQKLLEIIKSNKGTYKDLYEYANSIGLPLGQLLQKFLVNMDVSEVGQFASIVEEYGSGINETGVILQTLQNESNGLNLQGQAVAINKKTAEGVLGDIIFVPNAEQVLAHYGFRLIDNMIEKNADFLAKTGYASVIVRKYDNVGLHRRTKWAESCSWCLERVGSWDYPSTTTKMFERHQGCTCSIELRSGNSKEKVNNYYKKKIETKEYSTEYKATSPNLNRDTRGDMWGMRQDLAKFGGIPLTKTQGMKAEEIRKLYTDFRANEINKKKNVNEKIKATMDRKKDFLKSKGLDPSKMSYSKINSEYTRLTK